MTRLRLTDGVELSLEIPLAEARKALQAALAEGELLEINAGDVQLVINPQQVLYIQDVEGDDENGAALNGAALRPARVAG